MGGEGRTPRPTHQGRRIVGYKALGCFGTPGKGCEDPDRIVDPDDRAIAGRSDGGSGRKLLRRGLLLPELLDSVVAEIGDVDNAVHIDDDVARFTELGLTSTLLTPHLE